MDSYHGIKRSVTTEQEAQLREFLATLSRDALCDMIVDLVNDLKSAEAVADV